MHRCLTEPSESGSNSGATDCQCAASDFDGDQAHETDLELFLPLSMDWTNLAQETTSRYTSSVEIEPIADEVSNQQAVLSKALLAAALTSNSQPAGTHLTT